MCSCRIQQWTSLQLTFHKRAIYLVANLQKVSDEVGSRHGTKEDRKRERKCVCVRERMHRMSLQLTFYKRAIYLVANLQKVSDEVGCRAHRQREVGGWGRDPKKNVRGEIGGWGRVPFDEPYAPSLSTIYDGA